MSPQGCFADGIRAAASSVRLPIIVAAALLLALAGTTTADDSSAQIEFFEKRVRPVLVRYCYECHSAAAKEPKGGLLLDTREGIRGGGESGPAVIPGNVEESLLVSAVRHESLEMPPGKRLPEDAIADLAAWIRDGAADPRDKPADAAAVAADAWEARVQARREWWSLQPIVAHSLPSVRDQEWPANAIDYFILAKLEEQGLRPAPRADQRTLVRRLTYALTGLPPSKEIASCAEDNSLGAWERLVDQLLASPQFGERWARHWMDVVRYTDTYGYEWDIPAKGAWLYRDYLVRAFNAGVPFDKMVREQIAGDLLKTPRIDPVAQTNESRIGPMFFQMGEKRHGDSTEFNGIHQEMLDNKIDAFGKAFQGLTLSCARCHDHKFDAVSQREYYALAGLFFSSRWVTNTADAPDRNAAILEELKEIKPRLRAALAAVWLDELALFSEELASAASPAAGGEASADASPRVEVLRKLLSAAKAADRPVEDPLRPWALLAETAAAGGSIPQRWQSLAAEYAEQAQSRREQNARDYVVVADFRQAPPEGWSLDGAGLQERIAAGDFTVASEGDAAIGRLLPGGLFTHSLSPRMNGALRTPLLSRFDKPHISFEYVGGDFAAQRTVVDNAFLTEKQQYLNQPQLSWLTLSTQPAMKDRRVYLELATKTSNPNFPPRVGLGGACSEEQASDPQSWFGVRRVVLHESPAPPADELERFNRLFAGAAPGNVAQVADRYADWFRDAVQLWSEGAASRPLNEDDVQLLNWLLEQGLLTNRCETSTHPEIAALVDQYRALEAQLATPQTVNGMADVDPGFDCRVNLRGDYDQLGDAVPRGYLHALLGSRAEFSTEQSGRLELAEAVVSPANPLTARVFVNRVWHWLFGAGLAESPDDFGRASAPPSHPELLDDLAHRFMAEGWSLKSLVREIVASETWRQSQDADPRALETDPTNRLLHHYPLRRLEAEAIRDAMLAVSGRLDARLYGPPINPHRPKEDPQKRLFTGPLDGEGRRSIYTKITIMEPPRFLAVLNQPTPKIPTGKRDVTTTPATSLLLLNDPFVEQQAEIWARKLVTSGHGSPASRIESMFQTAFARPPLADESARWRQGVDDLARLHGAAPEETLVSIPVWKDIAHAIFNTKEFIYVR